MLLVLAALLAGYAPDGACAECHADRAKSYQHVAMARSFYRPRPEKLIEDFGAPPYFHEKSGQYFEMRRRGSDILFRRYQLTPDGVPVNVFEQIVDWIIGSGNHARTYVYRTPGGEMFQLPVNWYSQTREWAMAPGYDRADHEGVTRRIRHECLFCHNAFPDAAPEPLSYWRSQTFPEQLPEGIGCQRCHGPGIAHIDAARAKAAQAVVRSSIVNPSRLATRARNDVCYQCHMQPVVALQGVRRFGRDLYSFRPGQLLSGYLAQLDVTEVGVTRAERFEINHHPYRLEQSRCFTESEGQLSCLTCHDPHRKVAPADRAAHYRKACMSCHVKPHRIESDCTSCHMQPRRTQDVVHVVMTDHLIRRTPGGRELTAPRDEREPLLESVSFLRENEPGPLGDLYRLLPLIRATGGANAKAVERLEQLIEAAKPTEIEPYLDLAMGLLRQRRYADLERTAKRILERSPDQPLALEWLGLARAASTGRRQVAFPLLEQAVAAGSRPETEFNLGVFLATTGRTAEAIEHYERALAARPNFVAAWMRLAEAQLECGDRDGARASLGKALAIEPQNERARQALFECCG
jgi:tetratricopeptide (TPR) repeat protein